MSDAPATPTSRPDGLYLGEHTDAAHQRDGRPVGLDPASFTTHGVIVGMTGSGKTGLGTVLLEETLAQDVPVLVLDPKGDMGNLLLTFPDLAPDDFAPWVPAGADPAATAAQWAEGLAGWRVDRAEIGRLRATHPMTVYTPGSTAGVPLDVIGSLAAPPTEDPELRRDEAGAVVQGLLGLVGVTSDPLSGREHVLVANLVESAWAAGEALDLPTLLTRIVDPPVRKLGVIDIEQFFPRAERTELMLRFNGLLASPAFAAWGQGAPLDIESLLWTPEGRARAAIVYLAHLSDEERQMVVARVLGRLVTWMRSQSGSTKLRVLVYMDEVFGFVPPSAVPPAKGPILTLMKQARAFGVGVVLATQNPVDLDYKAISNAGTWMVGRLQTERDKARLLEGMTSAAGAVDIGAVDATISSLAKREFVLHTAGGSGPRTFGARWAMSYLCGPLSKDQLARLPGQAVPPPTPTPGAAVPEATAGPSPTAPGAAEALAHDETPTPPAVAEGTPVRHLDPAAPWAAELGAVAGGTRLEAALVLRAALVFDDAALDLRTTEEFELVLSPLAETFDGCGRTVVDFDDRDLVEAAPDRARYVLPAAPVTTKRWFTTMQSATRDWLVRERTTAVRTNRALRLVARPGETDEQFAARCAQAAETGADAEADALRQRLEAKIDVVRDALAQAQQRADQLQAEQSMSRTSEMVSIGGSVLGALFGGRKSASSLATAAGKVMTGRSRSQKAGNRVEQALARVEEKSANLADLEDQLAEDLADIVADWQAKAAEVTTVEVPLEKGDVTITAASLVWIPTAG